MLRMGKGGLCDPAVNQAHGRYKVDPKRSNKQMRLGELREWEERWCCLWSFRYFFWTFESRNDPASDPVFIVLSPGPGSASTVLAVAHNGPCTVNPDGASAKNNPYAWTTKANVVWLDHPVGVGYSTGSSQELDEGEVVTNVYNFVKYFRNYTRYEGALYIIGFSFAGHILPQVAKMMHQSKMALEGLIFVNAKIDPLSQYAYEYPFYPEMAFKSTTTKPVISQVQYKEMVSSMRDCLEQIKACNYQSALCRTADLFCRRVAYAPVKANGYNLYDLAQTCPHPADQLPRGCDNQENPPNIQKYMNSPTVKQFFGITDNYFSFNRTVYDSLKKYGLLKVDQSIPSLLEAGIRVMVIAGDRDYVCNYLGLKNWMLGMGWSKQEAFKSAPDVPVKDNTGREIGLRRSIDRGHYTFVQVYAAGHDPTREKPQETLRLVNDFVSRNF
ncbi:hypothetical protein FOL47_007884 [Perkinsus chesapeaki]|uniref:Thymus-specific serine protease n=1 Tax=Perkinsus chesapeaki TaxID=330153 RepID=A0A7J6LHB8_PERCH|nr:hypothetical protein FOL47_007884 [Perkinsus chesapeaki]